MDASRFDALTRVFAAAASRRRALGALAALAVAPRAAAAKPTPNAPEPAACLAIGKRCSLPAAAGAGHGKGKHGGKGGKRKHHPPSCSKCCSRYGAAGPDGKARCTCKGEGEACANPSQCCGGLCKNGQCTACPDGLTACAGNCVDLQTNGQHCGSCEQACDSGQRCVGGSCVCDGTSCPRGCCAKDGSCQRGTSDQACGVGGAGCQTCQPCTTCDGTTCGNATACCGDASVCQNGTCVACGANQRCQNGQCVCNATSCPNGCCDGDTCVAIKDQSDASCGTGGAACAACTECTTCSGGVCANKANGEECGGSNSGLRCCNGKCPPTPTCLNGHTCCESEAACEGRCCTEIITGVSPLYCPSTVACVHWEPGSPCFSDPDCDTPRGVDATMCVCGTCCVASGSNCYSQTTCCNGPCGDDFVCP